MSLFGLVLAIGIVVDDAIVVVEAVEHNIELGMQPKEATQKAMDQVGGAVVAIAVVLSAVFIPTAFITGITGQFYRQFALTIAVSTLISAFNSLTLESGTGRTSAEAARREARSPDSSLRLSVWLVFSSFQQGIRSQRERVHLGGPKAFTIRGDRVAGLRRFSGAHLFRIQNGAVGISFRHRTRVTSSSSRSCRTEHRSSDLKRFANRFRRSLANVPGVAHTVEFAGFSALDGTNRNNAVTTFLPLAPFEERMKDPRLNGFAIMAAVRQKFAGIQDARVLVFPPPPVRGIGNAGGFKIQIQDRRGAGLPALQAATDQLISKARTGHGLVGLFTSFRSQVPQLYLDIDRRKVETLDVPINSVFYTLQAYLGSTYVNDFNFVNRTDQVNVQADARFRIQPESIGQLYTRNNKNEMVPLGTLMSIQEVPGPDKVMHYNIYPSAEINGSTLPGVSSGQAIDVMQTLADQTLPSQFGYEWTELSLQEILAGNSALYIFPLCALFVFLVLAAQYESWSLPLWPSS